MLIKKHLHIILIVLLSISYAYADIYLYVDKEGVLHFSKEKKDDSYRLYMRDNPSTSAISKESIEEAQKLLTELGFDPGPIDGILREKTENSIKAFQLSIGRNETGLIDEKLIQQLRATVSKIKQKETGPNQGEGTNVHSADSGQPVRLFQEKSVVAPNAGKGSYQENWLLTLIFSTILACSIGLAPPILIRFVFVKHPISKHSALSLVFFFWVLSLVFISAFGSKSKMHVGLLIVAFASYSILRKGAAKYKRGQSKRQEDENHRNEEQQKKENNEKERRNQQNRHIKDEEYYRNILSLGNNFTVDEIKRRYRELVSKYHPDKVNHLGEKLKETAEREIKRINEAYEYFKKTYNFR